ncbi:hypothetical protein D3C86_1944610 [compost metagenome]
MKIREFLYNPAINIVHFTLTDEIRTPAGNQVFYITEKARKSYLMHYIDEEGIFVDTLNGLTLKRTNI